MNAGAETVRDKVMDALSGLDRVQEHAGEDSLEGVRADLHNLRAAVRELQQAVVLLAEEFDRRSQRPT